MRQRQITVAKYTFKCKECDYRWRVIQSVHDEHPMQCEECESENIRQVFSASGLLTCETSVRINERAKTLANSDWKKIGKGNEKALSSLVGDKVNPAKA